MSIDTTTDLDRTDLEAPDASDPSDPGTEPLVEEELLVEEVSIDGMCGVY